MVAAPVRHHDPESFWYVRLDNIQNALILSAEVLHHLAQGHSTAQIAEWSLPTRPAKKSDPEAAKFGDKAVELDAIDPAQLTALVENAITSHIDPPAWQVEQAVEAEERRGLEALAATFGGET